MKHDKDPRASIYTELMQIDLAHEVNTGPISRNTVDMFNMQPIHPTTLADVRDHAHMIKNRIVAEQRAMTLDESYALEMCKAVEHWLLQRMGFYGENQL